MKICLFSTVSSDYLLGSDNEEGEQPTLKYKIIDAQITQTEYFLILLCVTPGMSYSECIRGGGPRALVGGRLDHKYGRHLPWEPIELKEEHRNDVFLLHDDKTLDDKCVDPSLYDLMIKAPFIGEEDIDTPWREFVAHWQERAQKKRHKNPQKELAIRELFKREPALEEFVFTLKEEDFYDSESDRDSTVLPFEDEVVVTSSPDSSTETPQLKRKIDEDDDDTSSSGGGGGGKRQKRE